MTLRDIWERITASRYTLALEAEVMRLRAENRALLNSILGVAGVPPITLPAPDSIAKAGVAKAGVTKASGSGGGAGAANGSAGGTPAASANGTKPATGGAQVALPARRRSWQQINRLLELESSKKKPQ